IADLKTSVDGVQNSVNQISFDQQIQGVAPIVAAVTANERELRDITDGSLTAAEKRTRTNTLLGQIRSTTFDSQQVQLNTAVLNSDVPRSSSIMLAASTAL